MGHSSVNHNNDKLGFMAPLQPTFCTCLQSRVKSVVEKERMAGIKGKAKKKKA